MSRQGLRHGGCAALRRVHSYQWTSETEEGFRFNQCAAPAGYGLGPERERRKQAGHYSHEWHERGGCATYSTNTSERERLVAELDAGLVFINGMVPSDPRLPFGGVKKWGYRRELGVHGIREFVNIKTVWISEAPAAERRPGTE
jgi:hypothetical protein